MAFIVGAIIGTVGAVAGASIASKSAKKGTAAAVAGEERNIEFQRESRDLARSDSAPYREAGSTALSALMDMTGLTPNKSVSKQRWNDQYTDPSRPQSGTQRDVYGIPEGVNARDWMLERNRAGIEAGIFESDTQWETGTRPGDPGYQQSNPWAFRGQKNPTFGRASGGVIGYAQGGHYNINELGPENVYSQGSVTRNSQPQTVAPSTAGYVQPYGRANGGPIGPQVGYGGPQQLTGGVNKGPMDNRRSGPKYGSESQLPVMGPQQGYNGGGAVRWGGRNSGLGGMATGPEQGSGTYDQDGNVVENPGGREDGYSFQADPGYNFRFDEGQRMLERGAAARGGLLSGGFARKSQRYGQDYASGEYQNVYNRIANIAGLGQVSSQSSGNQAIAIGQGMGNSAANQGMSSAYGQQASGNAWANAANQVAQLPWGGVFNQGGGGNLNQFDQWGER